MMLKDAKALFKNKTKKHKKLRCPCTAGWEALLWLECKFDQTIMN